VALISLGNSRQFGRNEAAVLEYIRKQKTGQEPSAFGSATVAIMAAQASNRLAL
jgi:hypothetical protein